MEIGEEIIHMENVQKTYLLGVEGVPALRGVSLSVRRGEFVVVYGTSGGGKTTLLNVMGTIDKPTKGRLQLFGRAIDRRTTDSDLAHLRLRKLAFVFQTFNLIASMTALENIELPMILAGNLSPSERRARALDLLRRVGIERRASHIPARLSGGEQQRTTIARALANDPELLLMDEPTGDLDSVNTDVVLRLLVDLHGMEGKTIVMVTHDNSLKYYANRVVYLRDGKVQRIENIPMEQRAAHIENLRSRIAARLAVAQNPRTLSSEDFVVRRPEDYELYHTFANSNSNDDGMSKCVQDNSNHNAEEAARSKDPGNHATTTSCSSSSSSSPTLSATSVTHVGLHEPTNPSKPVRDYDPLILRGESSVVATEASSALPLEERRAYLKQFDGVADHSGIDELLAISRHRTTANHGIADDTGLDDLEAGPINPPMPNSAGGGGSGSGGGGSLFNV